MKILLIALIGNFLVYPCFSQQSKIQGLVSIFNSETFTGKRQFVSNAQVEDDFNKAQPTITDGRGQFKLIYIGTKDNESVSFQVKKSGLEVVNTDALSAVAGQNEVVKISMAKPGQISEYKRIIYKVGKTAAERSYEKLIKNLSNQISILKNDASANAAKIKELENKLADFINQNNKIDDQAEDLAKRYAVINLDDASVIFRKAFGFFKTGDLDSALALLNQEAYEIKVNDFQKEDQRIARDKGVIFIRDSLQNIRKSSYKEGLKLKADLHKTLYQFDSTEDCYKLLLKLDPNDLDIMFRYAYFLSWLNKKDSSIMLYKRALKTYQEIEKGRGVTYQATVGALYVSMGIVYYESNDFHNADTNLLNGIHLIKIATNRFPKLFLPDLARAYGSYAILLDALNESKKAEAAYITTLTIYDSLNKKTNDNYQDQICRYLNNLATLYSHTKQFDKAEVMFKKAYEYSQDLSKTDSSKYFPFLALAELNLAALYTDQVNYKNAKPFVDKSVVTYSQLAGKNPQSYNLNLIKALSNAGRYYTSIEQFKQGESYYVHALGIIKPLVSLTPNIYEPFLAVLENNIGILYGLMGKFDPGENYLIDAIKIRKRLMGLYPNIYSSKLKSSALELFTLYNRKFSSLGLKTFQTTNQDNFFKIDTVLELQAKADSEFLRSLMIYYSERSWYLLFVSKFQESTKYARKAFALDTLNMFLKMYLAQSLLFEGKIEESILLYKEIKKSKIQNLSNVLSEALDNFNLLEKNQITNPYVQKIRELLGKP